MMNYRELCRSYRVITHLRYDLVMGGSPDFKRMIDLDIAYKAVLEYKVEYLMDLLDDHNINPYGTRYLDITRRSA